MKKINIPSINSFEDMLHYKKILDEKYKSSRERVLNDDILSMIAELIEFNEETKYTHKTWKTKRFSKKKMIEELVDVWFFFCRICLRLKTQKINTEKEEYVYKPKDIGSEVNSIILFIIRQLSSHLKLQIVYDDMVKLVELMGLTMNDIYEAYAEKWYYNMYVRGDYNENK